MAPPLDFNATLAEQLRDAGMQMRAMSKPQKSKTPPGEVLQDESTQPPAAGADPAATHKDGAGAHGSDAASLLPGDPQSGTRSSRDSGNDSALDSLPDGTTAAQNVTAAHRAEAAAEAAARATIHSPDAPARTEGTAARGTAAAPTAGQAGYTADSQAASPTVTVTEDRAAHKTAAATAHAGGGATAAAPVTNTARPAAPATVGQGVSGAATGTAAPTAAATAPLGEASTDGMTALSAHAPAGTSTDTAAGASTATPTATSSVTETAASAATLTAGQTVAPSATHTTAAAATAADAATGAARSTTTDATPDAVTDAATEVATGAATGVMSGVPGGAHTAHLPDAASELWAMSHHSAAPTLSDRSWTGGVRGAVLDALRGLAGGRGHVLVNLKRLATHTGISYGSVRNAMSRLTRSGDIRTRQIRMADGHGVRVEFLTLPGQEGTGLSAGPLAASAALPAPNATAQPAAPHTAPGTGAATVGMTAAMTHELPPAGWAHPPVAAQQGHNAQGFAGGSPHPLAAPYMPAARAHEPAEHGSAACAPSGVLQSAPVSATLHAAVTAPTGAAVGATATQTVTQPAFWETDEALFALAWPHAEAAGLRMDALRALAPLFALQGFDPAILPRCLRYLDWELEMDGVGLSLDEGQPVSEEARSKARAFVRAMQRRGVWPRPVDYEGED